MPILTRVTRLLYTHGRVDYVVKSTAGRLVRKGHPTVMAGNPARKTQAEVISGVEV
jgi:hypothetical protein